MYTLVALCFFLFQRLTKLVSHPISKIVISPDHYIRDFENQYTDQKPGFILSVYMYATIQNYLYHKTEKFNPDYASVLHVGHFARESLWYIISLIFRKSASFFQDTSYARLTTDI